MTIAILYKRNKLEIYDNINAVNMENDRLSFTSGNPSPITCSSIYLDDVSKVSVNGIIYYANREARI